METAAYINVSVEDQGIGIAKKDLENIFKPFKMQYLRKARGNGVGLSICKQICEQMDGSFHV